MLYHSTCPARWTQESKLCNLWRNTQNFPRLPLHARCNDVLRSTPKCNLMYPRDRSTIFPATAFMKVRILNFTICTYIVSKCAEIQKSAWRVMKEIHLRLYARFDFNCADFHETDIFTVQIFTKQIFTVPTFTKPIFTVPTFTKLILTAPIFTKPIFTVPIFTTPIFTVSFSRNRFSLCRLSRNWFSLCRFSRKLISLCHFHETDFHVPTFTKLIFTCRFSRNWFSSADFHENRSYWDITCIEWFSDWKKNVEYTETFYLYSEAKHRFCSTDFCETSPYWTSLYGVIVY